MVVWACVGGTHRCTEDCLQTHILALIAAAPGSILRRTGRVAHCASTGAAEACSIHGLRAGQCRRWTRPREAGSGRCHACSCSSDRRCCMPGVCARQGTLWLQCLRQSLLCADRAHEYKPVGKYCGIRLASLWSCLKAEHVRANGRM